MIDQTDECLKDFRPVRDSEFSERASADPDLAGLRALRQEAITDIVDSAAANVEVIEVRRRWDRVASPVKRGSLSRDRSIERVDDMEA